MQNIDLSKIHHIHFIGIGGIGMSALARLFLSQGKKISGSDSALTTITEELEKLGISVSDTQDIQDIPNDVDLVVYTIAIKHYAPALLEGVGKRNIPMLTYPEALGLVSKDTYTIAVTGTHGKTTTTGMSGSMMIDAELKPAIVVGSILAREKSNFVAGDGKYFIVEGCEYERSFLQLAPNILIITNIEADHLDYYRDLDDIINAFEDLVAKVPHDGFIICDPSLPNVARAVHSAKATVIDYTDLFDEDLKLKNNSLYNKKNAACALALASVIGISLEEAKKSLENFEGTWRRFEYKGNMKSGAFVYDDYAHHPTEIRSMLAGAKEQFPDKKIIAIFEPHLFSRTRDFLDDFAKSFGSADEVILAPIYFAREKDDGSVSSEILAEKVKETGKKVVTLGNYQEIEKYMEKMSPREDTLVITIGAGPICKVAEDVVK